MAKDDYFIVAYRILSYLYGSFKAGEKPDVMDLKWEEKIDPNLDGYHEFIRKLSREWNFEYERKKKNQ